MPARLDELLKAAGEPTRLRILNLLREGRICVCDLQAALQLPQPTVSRHLGALRHANLVADMRHGPRVIYSLAPVASPQQKALLEFLVRATPNEGRFKADRVRLKRAARKRAGQLVRLSPARPGRESAGMRA